MKLQITNDQRHQCKRILGFQLPTRTPLKNVMIAAFTRTIIEPWLKRK